MAGLRQMVGSLSIGKFFQISSPAPEEDQSKQKQYEDKNQSKDQFLAEVPCWRADRKEAKGHEEA